MQKLTEPQRIVLSTMEDRNAEAIWFKRRWWFREELKRAPELAARMLTPQVLAVGPYWPL